MLLTFTSLDEQCVLNRFATLDQTDEELRLEKARILIVGYEPMLLSTRASILNRLEAHVATACSVEDALWHLAQEDYDLLFLCHTVDQDSACDLLNHVNFLYPSLKVARLHVDAVPKGMTPIVDVDVRMDYQPTSWLGALDALLLDAA